MPAILSVRCWAGFADLRTGFACRCLSRKPTLEGFTWLVVQQEKHNGEDEKLQMLEGKGAPSSRLMGRFRLVLSLETSRVVKYARRLWNPMMGVGTPTQKPGGSIVWKLRRNCYWRGNKTRVKVKIPKEMIKHFERKIFFFQHQGDETQGDPSALLTFPTGLPGSKELQNQARIISNRPSSTSCFTGGHKWNKKLCSMSRWPALHVAQ